MKKQLLITAFILLCSNFIFAQSSVHNIVFDMTSDDTITHKMGIRWINEESAQYPGIKIEMVFYGKSLGMITQGKSVVADAVKKFSDNKNIAFKVCAVALKNNNVDKSQLLPGVEIVPDGIQEIISKQKEGWGYIKVSH